MKFNKTTQTVKFRENSFGHCAMEEWNLAQTLMANGDHTVIDHIILYYCRATVFFLSYIVELRKHIAEDELVSYDLKTLVAESDVLNDKWKDIINMMQSYLVDGWRRHRDQVVWQTYKDFFSYPTIYNSIEDMMQELCYIAHNLEGCESKAGSSGGVNKLHL